MRNLVLAFACLAILAATPARADTAADERTVETLIREQIAAFGKDDGERAFTYAAPDIQKRFGDPVSFMAMVRKSYAAVYRPKSLNFLQPSWPAGQGEGVVLQGVEITDSLGRDLPGRATDRRRMAHRRLRLAPASRDGDLAQPPHTRSPAIRCASVSRSRTTCTVAPSTITSQARGREL
ncbi:MAG: DUF4864 domain-containing protein [Betaproteobacteria bacterium]|nr:DUF4864 domain-containing protein [Betaproteobacteria bacterium]